MAGRHRGDPADEDPATMLVILDGLHDAVLAANVRAKETGHPLVGAYYAEAGGQLLRARDSIVDAHHLEQAEGSRHD